MIDLLAARACISKPRPPAWSLSHRSTSPASAAAGVVCDTAHRLPKSQSAHRTTSATLLPRANAPPRHIRPPLVSPSLPRIPRHEEVELSLHTAVFHAIDLLHRCRWSEPSPCLSSASSSCIPPR